jgi:hypothetical protein
MTESAGKIERQISHRRRVPQFTSPQMRARKKQKWDENTPLSSHFPATEYWTAWDA